MLCEPTCENCQCKSRTLFEGRCLGCLNDRQARKFVIIAERTVLMEDFCFQFNFKRGLVDWPEALRM